MHVELYKSSCEVSVGARNGYLLKKKRFESKF